jgi:hypothetical protein
MYDTIQNILTYLIEAIAIIGFFGIAIHAMSRAAQEEILSWGMPTPHGIPQPKQKTTVEPSSPQLEASKDTEISLDTSDSDLWIMPTTASSFHSYSRYRLRKIARELKLRGYSRMEIPELLAEIANHPEAQRLCA